jgi:UDP-N-acetyl-D-glucosamine/UDP-N-acetyl-D-galactosamine dehydrogenase
MIKSTENTFAMIKKFKIAIIGLGYVGLPLAVEFSKHAEIIGFDLNQERINDLNAFIDKTNEVSEEELKHAQPSTTFTSDINILRNANFYIICVPTPIDELNQPDMRSLIGASETIGLVLSKGDYVVYESTVYPGATREICIPILSKKSSLILNKDFYVGYSPERINPGDKSHRLPDIIKVTSGSNLHSAEVIDAVYGCVISAGTFMVSSIEVAEAAKVIENTQRDLNIALVNELALIFQKMEIDTKEVIEAASTKWNFNAFYPGFVGGHCIGVDPYYLTFKAKEVGYDPKVILSGRELNDSMPEKVSEMLCKKMQDRDINIPLSKILIMGFSFKENCPDFRNTKVEALVHLLQPLVEQIDVYDPVIDLESAKKQFQTINFINKLKLNHYNAVVIAVSHSIFQDLQEGIKDCLHNPNVIFDLKGLFPANFSDLRL